MCLLKLKLRILEPGQIKNRFILKTPLNPKYDSETLYHLSTFLSTIFAVGIHYGLHLYCTNIHKMNTKLTQTHNKKCVAYIKCSIWADATISTVKSGMVIVKATTPPWSSKSMIFHHPYIYIYTN